MLITLKSNAKMKIFRVYFLNFADRQMIDDTFDKLHKQNEIKYITQFTSFEYLVFVI